jgi:hypothetical protein
MANGKSSAAAHAICTKSLQKSGNLKKGKATAKGKKRGTMTPAARAKDRAAKKKGGKASDYKYNKHNNSAVKGKVNRKVKRRA